MTLIDEYLKLFDKLYVSRLFESLNVKPQYGQGR